MIGLCQAYWLWGAASWGAGAGASSVVWGGGGGTSSTGLGAGVGSGAGAGGGGEGAFASSPDTSPKKSINNYLYYTIHMAQKTLILEMLLGIHAFYNM